MGDFFRELLDGEYREFVDACSKPQRRSFRVNTLKSDLGVAKGFDGEPISWCSTGFFTDSLVSDSVEHFTGQVYLQEAASMLAAEVLAPCVGDTVLDLCAAPGSKTTQISVMMKNTGCVIANEPDFKRLKSLRFNLNRMGVVNAVVTNMDGRLFPDKILFDKILLDAPCSNLGQIRENPHAAEIWSPSHVKKCSNLQKKLIDAGYKSLKKDGVLVYSTCTFTPEENEEVVDYAIQKYDLVCEKVRADIVHTPGLHRWGKNKFHEDVGNTMRVYPHQNNTGGFYVARLKKWW